MKTKVTFSINMLLCALAVSNASPCAAKSKEIYYNSGNLFDVGPSQSLADLLRAIKKHPHSRIFRISWDSSGSSSRDSSVILYDRRRHTLKHYYWEDSLLTEDLPIIRKESSRTLFYMGVQDKMIDQLLKKYQLAGMGAGEIFTKLVDLGCKKRLVLEKSHRYEVKQHG